MRHRYRKDVYIKMENLIYLNKIVKKINNDNLLVIETQNQLLYIKI